MIAIKFVAACAVIVVAPLTACQRTPSNTAAGSSGKTDFIRDVKPLLSGKCLPCHNVGTLSGELNLDSRRTAFGGSDDGAFIVPNDPEGSLIYTRTAKLHGQREAADTMPAVKGVTLTGDEREILRNWIADGAPWPMGEEGRLVPLEPRPNEA